MKLRPHNPIHQAAWAIERVRAARKPLRFFLGFRSEGRGEHSLRLSEERGRALVASLPWAELRVEPDAALDELVGQLAILAADLTGRVPHARSRTKRPAAGHGWRRRSRTPA